jgi:hypothetical protein
MAKTNRKYHMEIQTHRRNPFGLLRSTFWDKTEKKYKHDTLCRISGMTLTQLKNIQSAIQGKNFPVEHFEILDSREYGASFALFQLAKSIGLDKDIYSRTSDVWVKNALAMLIGRIIYRGSKLSLSNVCSFSALWEVCGIQEPEIDVDEHCYTALDELIKRQEAIQKKLASKHLRNGIVILYDMTSSYLEGEYENSELVKYGYNRDKKKGHPQITIGLICSSDGCPVSVKVFEGNKKDSDTVADKITEIKEKYGIEQAVFVGDRGMLTAGNLGACPYKTVTALRHDRIKALCNTDYVQFSMFDEQIINEIELPEEPGIRYALCLNPLRGEKERLIRQTLLEKTEELLRKIGSPKRKTSDDKLGVRVGKIINKYKVGKFFEISIADNQVTWSRRENKIAEEELYDGLYVIRSDVDKQSMTAADMVNAYRKLANVEQAFRILKTVRLEIRPIYHHKDERIRAHVFMCMLAYYLLWHMDQRLAPLFASDGVGKCRKYSLDYVLETLMAIRKQRVVIAGTELFIISTPNQQQQQILGLLGIQIS